VVGVGNEFLFSEDLSQDLVRKGVLSSNDAMVSTPKLRGREGWKSTDSLGLEGELVEEWNHYIELLLTNFISLDEEILDEYITELGYKACREAMHVGPKKWWWGYLWKFNSPLKYKITLWMALNNKFWTW